LNGSQHILSAQFSNDYAGWILNNGATTTNTVNYPNTHGTFIFGSNVERLSSNDVLLSGINTQSSPITVNLNFTTATTVTQSVRLTVMFDAVFQIDPMSKTCQIIQ
jgi:hypothetical protein